MNADDKDARIWQAQLESYKMLGALFNAEESAFWTRNNVLVTVQAILVTATTAIVTAVVRDLVNVSCPPWWVIVAPATLAFGLSLVGLWTSIYWIFMVRRGEFIANLIAAELKDIEYFWMRSQIIDKPFLVFNSFWLHLSGKDQVSIRGGATGFPYVDADGFPRVTFFSRFRISNIWSYAGMFLAVFWAVAMLLLFFFASAAYYKSAVDASCSKGWGVRNLIAGARP